MTSTFGPRLMFAGTMRQAVTDPGFYKGMIAAGGLGACSPRNVLNFRCIYTATIWGVDLV